MLRLIFTILAVGLILAGGCSSRQKASSFSQAQLNAIETREVEAGMEATFSAASGAMFDAGYTIAMSDRAAGLLTGKKATDNTASRVWVSASIRDEEFVMSVQIRSITPQLSAVRLKTSINGESIVEKEAIDAFWTLMQRQVLMKAPPAPEAPSAK